MRKPDEMMGVFQEHIRRRIAAVREEFAERRRLILTYGTINPPHLRKSDDES